MEWLLAVLFFLFVFLVPGFLTGYLFFRQEGHFLGTVLGLTAVLFVVPVLLFSISILFETNINRHLILLVAGVIIAAELSIIIFKRHYGK
jgi:hypothetical protein